MLVSRSRSRRQLASHALAEERSAAGPGSRFWATIHDGVDQETTAAISSKARFHSGDRHLTLNDPKDKDKAALSPFG
jgi:hypothetical protein